MAVAEGRCRGVGRALALLVHPLCAAGRCATPCSHAPCLPCSPWRLLITMPPGPRSHPTSRRGTKHCLLPSAPSVIGRSGAWPHKQQLLLGFSARSCLPPSAAASFPPGLLQCCRLATGTTCSCCRSCHPWAAPLLCASSPGEHQGHPCAAHCHCTSTAFYALPRCLPVANNTLRCCPGQALDWLLRPPLPPAVRAVATKPLLKTCWRVVWAGAGRAGCEGALPCSKLCFPSLPPLPAACTRTQGA